LQGDDRGDFQAGVRLGRDVFASVPEDNRIVVEDKRRWSMENHRDANFADMYLHPQEIDYNIETLFDLIDASGLTFIGFSNPGYWQIDRLLGKSPELMERASQLSDRQRYRLIELLDPELTHYEFFLGKKPLFKADWSQDAFLLSATPELSPCLQGWPAQSIFGPDYQWIQLTDEEFSFLQGCESAERSVGEILSTGGLDLAGVRSLLDRQLILLTP
ncbi:MAG: SAM-dependent methyltransferase, partial [Geitlerinemataceae cyanobacterium]